uniref:Uncharacterized protein n=1 Tax=Arundo donax TaxID=35708 RepID=A0A0A9AN48_ARUDO
MLHPKKLQLNIYPSDVIVQRYGSTGGYIYYVFRSYLEAISHSDRAFIYYSNITVKLIDGTERIAEFNMTPSSISLSLQEDQEYVVYGHVHAEEVSNVTVAKLFTVEKGGEIKDAAMTLEGLITDNAEEGMPAVYRATYNCEPVDVKSNVKLPEPSSSNDNNRKWKCVPSVF